MTRTTILVVAAAALGSGASAQPRLQIRFSQNGLPIIGDVQPGSVVPLQVWVSGMPFVGSNIAWLTNPGTGQIGQYAGFLSALFDVDATSASTVSWSNLTIAPPFVGPPFGNAGTASGSSVNGINIGVGFNPPVTSSAFLLWTGSVTVGTSDVDIHTAIQPTGNPPYTGLEVALGGIIPGLVVSHFMTAIEGEGHISIVPAPAAGVSLTLGAMLLTRRRSRPQC